MKKEIIGKKATIEYNQKTFIGKIAEKFSKRYED